MNESSPVDRSRLTALAEKARVQRYWFSPRAISAAGIAPARSEFIAACSPDVVLALLAELAEKDAEIERLRTGPLGDDERSRMNACETRELTDALDAAEVRASTAERERADALASLELHRAENARLSAELVDPLGDLVCGSCEGPTKNVDLYCDACHMGDLEEEADRLRVRASTAEAALAKLREAVGTQHGWGCRRDMSGSGPCDCVNGKVRAAAALVVGDENA